MKASHGQWCGASWFDKLTMKRFASHFGCGPKAALCLCGESSSSHRSGRSRHACLAQGAAAHLAGIVAQEVVDELERARHLVADQPRLEPGAQVVGAEAGAGRQRAAEALERGGQAATLPNRLARTSSTVSTSARVTSASRTP